MKPINLPGLPPLSQLQPVHWLALGLTALLTAGTASVLAIRLLLDSNANLPNCQNPEGLAPLEQIYCADNIAGKGSNEDLQSAIAMVAAIPTDEPLRESGDRRVELWAKELLERGEAAFQDGKLEEAIKIAQLIPIHVVPRDQAEAQIKSWQSIWDKADEVYQEAQGQLEIEDNQNFLATARKLLPIGNRYWATIKYQELMEQLESRQRQQTHQPVPNPSTAANSSAKIPDPAQQWFENQQQGANARLAKARQLAEQGNLTNLKAAVTEAEQAVFNVSNSDRAQQEIENWKRQIEAIEDEAQFERAMRLARKGDENSLQAAIDQANQIFYGRRLYDKAQRQIEQWNRELVNLQNQKLNQVLYGNKSSNP
ncbi:MAG: hypothetical protein ACKO24_03150 [Leptolyngbyaceae cyanobacterium]